MGGDSEFLLRAIDHGVSIHASTWEATHQFAYHYIQIQFQSTPPHGRRLLVFTRRVTTKFQSTPPHGRRPLQEIRTHHRRVSIHASTWEATSRVVFCGNVHSVSIHASTWEATLYLDSHLIFIELLITFCEPMTMRFIWFQQKEHICLIVNKCEHKVFFVLHNIRNHKTRTSFTL